MPNEKNNLTPQNGSDMEPISEFDQNHFYETNHIDEKTFNEDIRSNEPIVEQEISGTISVSDRIAQEEKAKNHPVQHEVNTKPSTTPTQEDGHKLMDVGRAPDA